jgi:hypothetical protein
MANISEPKWKSWIGTWNFYLYLKIKFSMANKYSQSRFESYKLRQKYLKWQGNDIVR